MKSGTVKTKGRAENWSCPTSCIYAPERLGLALKHSLFK